MDRQGRRCHEGLCVLTESVQRTVACLKNKTLDEIYSNIPHVGGGTQWRWGFVQAFLSSLSALQDSIYLPDRLEKLALTRSPVPIMLGNAKDEWLQKSKGRSGEGLSYSRRRKWEPCWVHEELHDQHAQHGSRLKVLHQSWSDHDKQQNLCRRSSRRRPSAICLRQQLVRGGQCELGIEHCQGDLSSEEKILH